jgi:hypothetical protein
MLLARQLTWRVFSTPLTDIVDSTSAYVRRGTNGAWGVEDNEAAVGDFFDGPEQIFLCHVAEPIRDEGLAIPVPVCQEYG